MKKLLCSLAAAGAAAAFGETGGTLFVEDGDELSWSSALNVGLAFDAARMWQVAGSQTFAQGMNLSVGGDGAAGYFRIDGGTLKPGSSNSGNSFFLYAPTTGSSQFHLHGGTVDDYTTGANNSKAGLSLRMSGASDGGEVVFYADGGSFATRSTIDFDASDNQPLFGSLTVDGTARVSSNRLRMGMVAGAGNRIDVNLIGGTLAPQDVFVAWGTYTGEGYLNFNGGTYEAPNTSGTYISPKTAIVVYPKGGTIYCPVNGVKFSKPLRSAEGWGVERITLTNPGAGYVTPPRVFIEGGSGSNATAIAVLTKSRTIEKIVVTCPGEGYLPGEAVTVRFVSANGSGAAATVTLVENTEPVLWKTGSGTLTLGADSPFKGTIAYTRGGVALASGVSAPNLKLRLVADSTNVTIPSTGALTYESYTNRDGYVTVEHMDMINNRKVSITDNPHILPGMALPTSWGMINSLTNRIVRYDTATKTLTSSGRLNFNGATDLPNSDVCTVNGTSSSAPFEYDGTVNGIYHTFEQFYVKSTSGNENVVQGGMILEANNRAGSGVIRLATAKVDGQKQTMTTRHPDGLMYLSVNGNTRGPSSAGNTRRLLLDTCFADPVGGSPMRLTLAGPDMASPNVGAWPWLMGENTFSGGLHLVNTLVHSYTGDDNTFGAAGGAIVSAGWSGISADANMTLDGTRTVTVRNGLFNLLPAGKTFTIDAKLTGPGDVLAGQVYRNYSNDNLLNGTVTLNGDNSGLTGTLFVGNVRLYGTDGTGIPSNANLAFCNNLSCWHTKGEMTRAPGVGPGQVSWRKCNGLGSARGGFHAEGGDLTVNMGGDARVFELGTDYCGGAGPVIELGGASGCAVTFVNPVELWGNTAVFFLNNASEPTRFTGDFTNGSAKHPAMVRVTGKPAVFEGRTAGDITIDLKDGASATFARAEQEVDLADLKPVFTVTGGAVTIAEGCRVKITTADAAALRALHGEELVIATAEDVAITGAFAPETNVPGWKVKTDGSRVVAYYRNPGTVLVVR